MTPAPNNSGPSWGRESQEHYARLAKEYDEKANAACKRAYRRLAAHYLKDAQRILELGAGVTTYVSHDAFHIACDASLPMLRARRPGEQGIRIAADAQRLPCRAAAFDAVLSVNLLEHVPDPAALFKEAARVLSDGGRCLMITPNGNHRRLLYLLERLHLKLPEGPHRFLTFSELHALAESHFELLEHRCFLALPLGPEWLVRLTDHVFPFRNGCGLFQYLVLRKKASRSK